MASPTWWTWVWTSSRSWWCTGTPGMLQPMRSQSQTRLRNWTQLTASLIFHWASFEIFRYNTIQLRVHDNQIEEHFLKSQYAYNTEAPFDRNWALRPLGSRFGLCSPHKHFLLWPLIYWEHPGESKRHECCSLFGIRSHSHVWWMRLAPRGARKDNSVFRKKLSQRRENLAQWSRLEKQFQEWPNS